MDPLNPSKFDLIAIRFLEELVRMDIIFEMMEWCCPKHKKAAKEKVDSMAQSFTQCIKDVGAGRASDQEGIEFLQYGMELIAAIILRTELDMTKPEAAEIDAATIQAELLERVALFEKVLGVKLRQDDSETFIQNVPHGGNA